MRLCAADASKLRRMMAGVGIVKIKAWLRQVVRAPVSYQSSRGQGMTRLSCFKRKYELLLIPIFLDFGPG
jgi:hypothetical protein